MIKKIIVVFSIFIFLVSCSSVANNRLKFADNYRNKKIKDYQAVKEKLYSEDFYSDDSEFLKFFDRGLIEHVLGNDSLSNEYLKRALLISDSLKTISVSNEALTFLANDNIRPYRAKNYEIIFLHFFSLINYLTMDDLESAIVEYRMCEEMLIHDEVDYYRGESIIYLLGSICYYWEGEIDDSAIALTRSLNSIRKANDEIPDDLSNFAYHIFKMSDRESEIENFNLRPNGDSDYQVKSLELSYSGIISPLREAIIRATYVDGAGLAVYGNDEFSRNLDPVILPEFSDKKSSGSTFHIKLSMPTTSFSKYSDNKKHFSFLSDQLVYSDLKERYNGILIKTASRSLSKAILASKAKKNLKNENPIVNLLINLGFDVMYDASESADIRMSLWIPQIVDIKFKEYESAPKVKVNAF
ncbi:MAG: hypothetical protein JXR48_12050 [Candidatus Delongbacteria bacterium]|nr:hypothetical protein [Candidatus Delongbacteria bacterium]MBN2835685.1 hypothetical protein [Candidatus Delongbacteria bacterium]